MNGWYNTQAWWSFTNREYLLRSFEEPSGPVLQDQIAMPGQINYNGGLAGQTVASLPGVNMAETQQGLFTDDSPLQAILNAVFGSRQNKNIG